jgi:hypothetical protein
MIDVDDTDGKDDKDQEKKSPDNEHGEADVYVTVVKICHGACNSGLFYE